MEKRPVISTLRAMHPGDTEVFPIEQRNSVVNTYTTMMYKEKKEGWVFSYKNDIDAEVTVVTRVK